MKQAQREIAIEDLAIYKFQPDNIIMVHKKTKQLYQYFQTAILKPKQTTLDHEHLQQAKFLPTGIIYQNGVSNMQNQISKRMKANVKHYFEEQELKNTFLPVLLCLQYLHSQNIVHGSINPKNIIFNEQGEVLLRDGILQISNNKYYETQKINLRTKNDDISALGQIIYEASSLSQFKDQIIAKKDLNILLKNLIPQYSRGYILAIHIMIKKVLKFYPYLERILGNHQSFINDSKQLQSIYRTIKGQNQTKPLISPLIKYISLKNSDLTFKTPVTIKKVPKTQNAENKTNFEDTQRKNLDRINRIVQKNLNNQSNKIADMALKKMSNIKVPTQQQNEKNLKKIALKQDVLKFSTPLKRLKSFSRKKAL